MKSKAKPKFKILGQQIESWEVLPGGESNKTFLANERFVFKQFRLTAQKIRESAGINLFATIDGLNTPIMLDAGTNFILSEFVSSSVTADVALKLGQVDLGLVSAEVAAFISQAFNRSKFLGNKLLLFPGLSWQERVMCVQQAVLSNQNALLTLLGRRMFAALIENLRSLATQDFSDSMTFVHRDLHLGNILIDDRRKFTFIDFEHCMQGPLELELQNSLFWDDEFCLPVNRIVDLLVNVYKLPFDKQAERNLIWFYFADQLILAIERGENDKLSLLVNRFNSYNATNEII